MDRALRVGGYLLGTFLVVLGGFVVIGGVAVLPIRWNRVPATGPAALFMGLSWLSLGIGTILAGRLHHPDADHRRVRRLLDICFVAAAGFFVFAVMGHVIRVFNPGAH